jgi:hypothetical protein
MKIGDLVYIKTDALKSAVQYQTGLSKINKSKVLKAAKSPQVIEAITQVGVALYYTIKLCGKGYMFMDSELVDINEGV